MKQNLPAACQLSVFFATHASRALILRRGPSAWTSMYLWDTSNDHIEQGQALHARVYVERCDLSPDGELFLYFALKHGHVDRDRGYDRCYTAVSRPPFFTALALWPWGGTWGGGGQFLANRRVRLAARLIPPPHPQHLPKGLEVLNAEAKSYQGSVGPCPRLFLNKDQTDGIEGVDNQGRKILLRDGQLFVEGVSDRWSLLRDFRADQGITKPSSFPSKEWPAC